jgi:hypothetical protein
MSEKGLGPQQLKIDSEEPDRAARDLDEGLQANLTTEKMLKAKIEEALETLTYREREIIKLRYGLGNGNPLTLEEVGRIFKVTLQRVRQIEAKGVRKLQHPVRRRPLEVLLEFLRRDGPTTPEGYLLEAIFGVHIADTQPRLFKHAYSERCQDAFVSWLIEWAQHDYRELDMPLHQTAVYFLNQLLSLYGVPTRDRFTALKIHPQYGQRRASCAMGRQYIDILVEVDNDFVLLIEDKVDDIANPGELEGYLATVENDLRFKGRRPVPVFLKTGDGDNGVDVEKAGWRHFRRRHMLEVMKYGWRLGVKSDIFRDFHFRLMKMQRKCLRKRLGVVY